MNFENESANSISTHIQNIFQNCISISDPTGAVNEPLTYKEVAGVCSNLKPGVPGVSLDYEHVGYAGPCGLCWSPALEVVISLVPTVFETFQLVNF